VIFNEIKNTLNIGFYSMGTLRPTIDNEFYLNRLIFAGMKGFKTTE